MIKKVYRKVGTILKPKEMTNKELRILIKEALFCTTTFTYIIPSVLYALILSSIVEYAFPGSGNFVLKESLI